MYGGASLTNISQGNFDTVHLISDNELVEVRDMFLAGQVRSNIPSTPLATDVLNLPGLITQLALKANDADVYSIGEVNNLIANNPSPIRPQGPIGVMGPQGPSGRVGALGPVGPAGSSGKDGIDGSNGSNGSPGAAGSDGNNGSPGVQRIQGIQGIQGETGAAGSGSVLTTAEQTWIDQAEVNMTQISNGVTRCCSTTLV